MNKNTLDSIKTYIYERDFISAGQMIAAYEEKTGNDYDLLIIKTLFYLYQEDYDHACGFAEQAVKKNRLNLEANLNMAMTYEIQEKWQECYNYYSRLFALQEIFQNEIVKKDDLLSVTDKILQKMVEYLKGLTGEEYLEYYNKVNSLNQVETDLTFNVFHEMNDIDYYFGKHRLYNADYYFARYDDWYHSFTRPDRAMNGTESKTEIVRIRSCGNEYTYNETGPCIVPCIINPEKGINTVAIMNEAGEECNIVEAGIKFSSYFKINGVTRIKADQSMVFGEPVLLKQSKDLKKLVFHIFIDSFNYEFLKDYPLEEVMPNTYRFFKDGIICSNAYVGSEFTYPSVPSYWTGMRPNRHKMLNPDLQFDIPEDLKLISEQFKEAGYFTAKIGGNCSALPNHGYLRGIDRYVFERYQQNFNAQQVVLEAIEHMETYQDTNQFIWMEIEDLHDVAGGWQRTSSVQVKAPYTAREIDNSGGSSLYQSFSPNKREIYKEELRHIDLYLGFLYQYIKEHYQKEEVVISLISDHGNGFNVADGQPFLSDQRMRVPMMFYCDWQGEPECNEIIESIDYISIISKLSGIDLSTLSNNDGQLPYFFGGKKKDYAVSQSIYPNKPYVAAIFRENQKFYLETVNPSSQDLRIDFSKIEYDIVDKEDNAIEDEAAVAENLSILRDLISDFNLYNNQV